MVQARDVEKYYGAFRALRGVSRRSRRLIGRAEMMRTRFRRMVKDTKSGRPSFVSPKAGPPPVTGRPCAAAIALARRVL